MLGYTIEVLTPFLSFAKTYSTMKKHNMMAITIDPRHKILKVIQEYMEIYIVFCPLWKNIQKLVMPMLLQVHQNLNLTNVVLLKHIPLVDEYLFFGQFVSNDDLLNHCWKTNCTCFGCLQINLNDCENPLVLGYTWYNQFSHVVYLTHLVLKIVDEIERMFNICEEWSLTCGNPNMEWKILTCLSWSTKNRWMMFVWVANEGDTFPLLNSLMLRMHWSKTMKNWFLIMGFFFGKMNVNARCIGILDLKINTISCWRQFRV